MLDESLFELFNCLNKNNVNYCVIRDYYDEELINNGDDIDLMIHPTEIKRFDELIKTIGWSSPKVNPNAYAHVQYFKCQRGKIYKIDVLKGMYYSDGLYRLNTDLLKITYENEMGMQIPSKQFALLFMLLHVILDKGHISKKNAFQIEDLVNKISKCDEWWFEIAKSIVEGKDYELKNREEYIKKIEKQECINKLSNRGWIIKRRLLSYIWRYYIKKNKFVVLGVDGTGKSSTIARLQEIYGENVFVQYMGFRSYKSKMAKKWATNNAPKIKIPGINLLMQQVSCYLEMLNRYKIAYKSKKKIILFDRYAWEAYDNARNKITGVISWCLFKALFPSPDHIIYLYCPTNVSLNRKNDIDDIDGFIKMKERMDSIYMKKNKVLVIDTSINNIESVLDIVRTFICIETQGYAK